MPVLFIGHGSPMNAIEENEFVKGSGNMVHNFGMAAWDKLYVPGYGYDCAIASYIIIAQV